MKSMLISVGGAPAPIINSIENHKPDKIIFFVSKGSREQVSKEIMPIVFEKNKSLIDHEFIVTENEQDIGESTRILLNEVPKAMQKLGIEQPWADIVDYTGGTKTMSAAMVWASSKFPCSFNYVGGTNRSKGGLGIVTDGYETNVTLQNPWNKLAYFEINDAIKLFNRCQYANSAELFAQIANKVSDDRAKRIFTVLYNITEAYSQWDIFNHKDAIRILGQNIKPLLDISESERFYLPNLKIFSEKVQENFDFLKDIKHQKLSWFMIYDLIANALRRANVEKKYEDATARVYSAIEKIAKHQLILKYGIDNSKCDKFQLPEKLQQDYFAKYANKDNILQFGVVASFNVLQTLGDIYGKRFANCANINEHLSERNYSILGHGMQAIKENNFIDLLDDAMVIVNVKEDELPLFPKL